jgi:hypothetical protein
MISGFWKRCCRDGPRKRAKKMTKKAAATTQQAAKTRRPPQLAKFCWPKGVSGNPSGKNGFVHHKILAQMMIQYLEEIDPEDLKKLAAWRRKKKHKKNEAEPVPLQRGQKLIQQWFERAIKDSDYLLTEILNRLEGKQPPESAKEREQQRRPSITVIDIGRPPRVAPSIIPEVHVPDRLISPPQPEQSPEEKK